MAKDEKILTAWNEVAKTLDLNSDQNTALENLFTEIQEKFSFQEAQFLLLKNSVRLIKEDRFDSPQLRTRKEDYAYLDSTEAAVQISRFDLLTYLVSTAEKGKHEGVPVLNMSDARIESAVESVNRVIMAPGKYRVRFLMAIWNPYFDGKDSNRRVLRCFFETENHDLFFVKVSRNSKFEYYSPARQENMELKNSAIWLQPMFATFSLNRSSTFLQLDYLEPSEENWEEEKL
ncbi:MAG: hypothetical protein E7A37_06405 [Negativicoccus succinicivorans]|uniref:hypothetical protein n=1 Tax=Negativicoccus succinicivorans TaxID=620903 RepID=UPI002903A894|nr:hypothetical protein [Negativicoccus succinicivorans]MDU1056659.1 hypothetical protein [Negativicoccus succinicivorans]MDU5530050.1 hypothetical protein [Negativicoccus succinicivorans]